MRLHEGKFKNALKTHFVDVNSWYGNLALILESNSFKLLSFLI